MVPGLGNNRGERHTKNCRKVVDGWLLGFSGSWINVLWIMPLTAEMTQNPEFGVFYGAVCESTSQLHFFCACWMCSTFYSQLVGHHGYYLLHIEEALSRHVRY
jgi:hypothetical protein